MECEICGAANASKKMEIEGTQLVVCEKCAPLGEVRGPATKPRKEKVSVKSKTSSGFKRDKKVLKRDYGRRVREARESHDLSIKELAAKLGEKKSVVKRIENQRLKPDGKLSKKLEGELGVKLFAQSKKEYKGKKTKGSKLTIGDVVEVK